MKRIIFVLTAAALVSGCGIFGGGGDKKRTPVLGERLPILVYEANAEPDPELADVTIVLPAPRTNEEWTQPRSEEHTSELQSLMRISYAVFCLKKKKHINTNETYIQLIK